MDPNLLEEPIWYKNDVVGMDETSGKGKKNNEGDGKDDITKNEDYPSIREFK